MSNQFVAILMGSKSDLDVMQLTADTLEQYDIPYELNILSAHRSPKQTQEYVTDATRRGAQVFIAAAGLAAHLAGAVSAQTIRPVIGVPLNAGSLGGLDALLATVQMPGGMPVATTAIGKPGAQNAAILAAQILGLQDERISRTIQAKRDEKLNALLQANQALTIED